MKIINSKLVIDIIDKFSLGITKKHKAPTCTSLDTMLIKYCTNKSLQQKKCIIIFITKAWLQK